MTTTIEVTKIEKQAKGRLLFNVRAYTPEGRIGGFLRKSNGSAGRLRNQPFAPAGIVFTSSAVSVTTLVPLIEA